MPTLTERVKYLENLVQQLQADASAKEAGKAPTVKTEAIEKVPAPKITNASAAIALRRRVAV
jgi:hypothetical protein